MESTLKELVLTELNPPLNATLVTDSRGLGEVREFLDSVTEFGFDTETNVTNTFYTRKLRTIQIGNKDNQFIIDLLPFAGNTSRLVEGQGHYNPGPEFQSVIQTLRPALESNTHLKVGTNLQFDYEVLKWCMGMRPWNFYDCRLAETCILLGLVSPQSEGHFALDDMVEKYYRMKISKAEQTSFDLETPLRQDQINYCALDTRLPLGVMGCQKKILEKDGLARVASVEFNAVPAFGDMRLNGMYASREAWQKVYDATTAKVAESIKELDTHFIPIVGQKKLPDIDVPELTRQWEYAKQNNLPSGAAFRALQKGCSQMNAAIKEMSTFEGEAAINYGSSEQLKEAIWKLPCFTQKNLPDTNDKTLTKVSQTHPVIKALQNYREHTKMADTYGIQFLDKYTDKNTGRIHSSIWQIGTNTGRTSSNKPNVQNLPSELRQCIVGEDGKEITASDMSGAELRIITEYSQEESWIDAFLNDYDVHSIGASLVFEKPIAKFAAWAAVVEDGCAFLAGKKKCNCKTHKKLRQIAKSINFGIAYGMTEYRLSSELGIGLSEARQILSAYREAFKKLLETLERIGETALQKFEARTIIGRRRQFEKPTWGKSREKAQKKWAEKLKRPGYAPDREVMKLHQAILGSIRREGMNHPIQGTNADIAKIAMGCGFDKNGKPFMWHKLEPEFKSKQINFVHDEFVTEQPPEYSEAAASWVRDCIGRAGAEVLTVVKMESESSTHTNWCKD